MDDHLVELNIGGVHYTTSSTTLRRYEESMLYLMLEGSVPTSRDSSGRYFIDRDGQLFRHILNYLRTGKLVLPEEFTDLFNLRLEADFYRIDILCGEIDELILTRQEKLARKALLDSEKLQHYQNSNAPKFDHVQLGYHLDLIEHNFLNTNNRRLQIITHFDVFKILPLTVDDMNMMQSFKEKIHASPNVSYKANDAPCFYLGNDMFELQNISYMTRAQISHILLQLNAKLLNSNIAYLNSNNNNAYNLSIYDKWFVPKDIADKYANICMAQKALPPSRTVGYIDWNPQ